MVNAVRDSKCVLRVFIYCGALSPSRSFCLFVFFVSLLSQYCRRSHGCVLMQYIFKRRLTDYCEKKKNNGELSQRFQIVVISRMLLHAPSVLLRTGIRKTTLDDGVDRPRLAVSRTQCWEDLKCL